MNSDPWTALRRMFNQAIFSWNHFWFGAEPFAQLRIYRVVLGSVLLLFYLIRSLDLLFLYSNQGVVPLEPFQSAVSLKYAFSIFYHFPQDWALWLADFMLIGACISLILGVYPRISALIVYLLHISFDHRNPMIAYGFNKVTVFFVFSLLLASYRSERAPRGSLRRSLASLALRLAQVQLCVIYVFSGTEKLKGVTWWRGEAIWGTLSNAHITSINFNFLSHFPLILTVMTFATLVWEIYFPVMVWSRRFRYPWLLGGVFLHSGIALTMNIPFFAFVMVAAYAVFLRRRDAIALERRFEAWTRKSGVILRSFFKKRESVPVFADESGN